MSNLLKILILMLVLRLTIPVGIWNSIKDESKADLIRTATEKYFENSRCIKYQIYYTYKEDNVLIQVNCSEFEI